MRFGSVCSGIEAASVAFGPLGWEAAWLSEIEPFPCAVLKHHYPAVPNLGDMTLLPDKIMAGEVEAPDMLCGGTPCQAFSVAGNRHSLADRRGNLTLTFVDIADAIDHVRSQRNEPGAIVFWENVPGVLSTKDNAFGCFLGALAGADCELRPTGKSGKWSNAGVVLGPKRAIAWRVLDAQYFGLAQRRKRVFVVASSREGFDPAAVLLEFDGVRRDSAPRREAWEGATGGTTRRPDSGHVVDALTANNGQRNEVSDVVNGSVIPWPADIACTLNAAFGDKQGLEDQHALSGASLFVPAHRDNDVAHILRGEGFDASEDGTGRGTPLVPTIAFSCKDHAADELAPTLRAMGHGASHANAGGQVAVAFHPTQTPISSNEVCHALGANANANATAAVAIRGREGGGTAELGDDCGHALRASQGGGDKPHVLQNMAVRRLTPRECERLQGFPDGYTAIPYRNKPADKCPDGPRYKALGNSWAVPCVAWIGRRIANQLTKETAP